MMYFQGSQVDESAASGFEPLEKGTYRLYVASAETKPTKAGTGSYVNVELNVVDGPKSGHKLFDIFNIQNPNEKATQIGRAQFKKFLMACKAPVDLQSEDQMKAAVVGKVLYAKVDVKKRTDKDEMQNIIREYSSAPWAAPSASPAAQPTSLDSVPW